MRGLETRVMLARARILALLDPEAASDDLMEVDLRAHWEGMVDAAQAVDTPPAMFADEDGLLRAWRAGWCFQVELEDMQDCASCQAAHGDPCPHHG